jgi:chlorite dismutase
MTDTLIPTDTDPALESTQPSPPTVNHVFFMLVRTTPTWLSLTPDERFAFLGEGVAPILDRHPDVSMRFFDSEAFNADYTDVVMWETRSIMSYQAIVEELRETPFWGTYFEVVDIVAAIENAYAMQYDVDPL